MATTILAASDLHSWICSLTVLAHQLQYAKQQHGNKQRHVKSVKLLRPESCRIQRSCCSEQKKKHDVRQQLESLDEHAQNKQACRIPSVPQHINETNNISKTIAINTTCG